MRFKEFTHPIDWLLNSAGTMTGELFSQLGDGHIFLITSIRHPELLTYVEGLELYMPEAVGQSIAWAKAVGFVMSLCKTCVTEAFQAKTKYVSASPMGRHGHSVSLNRQMACGRIIPRPRSSLPKSLCKRPISSCSNLSSYFSNG